jgi:RNA recognition motif. (a.k.a. RRM, RBD, or RNP domain)
MASKLYVGGLSYSTTSETLRQYFAQCGTVESAAVITDRMSGDSRGFGFVEMSTDAEAQAAIGKLNEQTFEGRKLTVNVAKAPGTGGGARSGGLQRRSAQDATVHGRLASPAERGSRQSGADIRRAPRRRTHRTMGSPMGHAVGAVVPPLLIAAVTVVVVGRLTEDSRGKLQLISRLPLPPYRNGQHGTDDQGERKQRRGVRYAEDADPEGDEKSSPSHSRPTPSMSQACG